MTNGTTKQDPDAPPSYAAVVRGEPATTEPGGPGPSRTTYGPTPINHGYQPGHPSHPQAPLLDPRSQAAREQARHRAAVRFCEALLWALVIQMIAAAIIGGSLWPEWRRHWMNAHVTE
ncbi:hypothetical protein M408DRAFT_328786 [Serendipita vermifera MAFF 305830]|uniref:Uncharacterized protein n=1 Tax=Serendipita vermifera MAFF 305830 TaxID=933852 RepID=A0A0C3BDM6_SERVB|nr:hypothetical protein M408DRAFT_328786 [Serendipita vermifera MAFF 305830]